MAISNPSSNLCLVHFPYTYHTSQVCILINAHRTGIFEACYNKSLLYTEQTQANLINVHLIGKLGVTEAQKQEIFSQS